MSGGYFERNIYAIGEISASIEHDIARALRPKPEKVHEDYWTIYEHDSPCSCRSFDGWGYMTFDKYEEAESFLLSRKGIVKAEEKYIDNRSIRIGETLPVSYTDGIKEVRMRVTLASGEVLVSHGRIYS